MHPIHLLKWHIFYCGTDKKHKCIFCQVETAKYEITDVVVPLVGTRIELVTNSTGDLFETILEDEL